MISIKKLILLICAIAFSITPSIALAQEATFFNNGFGHVTVSVENIAERKAVFVLKSASNITWKKTITFFKQYPGGVGDAKILDILTVDQKHEETVSFKPEDLTDYLKLEFWKDTGFIVIVGQKVAETQYEKNAILGKKITFTWHKD